MKHDPKEKRTRRGFMIMAGLLLAAVVVFNMDAIAERFSGYVDVVAVVLETNGVRVGSPVAVEGMVVGRVRGIELTELDERGAIALQVRLEDHVRPVVRAGSRVYTTRRNMIGEPVVRVSAGPTASPPLESGDTIYPLERPSIDRLMSQGKAFPSALDSLATALSELEGLVSARRPELEAVAERLALAADEAATLQEALGGDGVGQWLRDPTLGRRIDRLKLRMASLSEATAGIERYGDPELRGRVAALGARASAVGGALEDLERRLAEGDGMLNRMGRDSALAVAITGVQAQIDSLSAVGLGFALRMFLP